MHTLPLIMCCAVIRWNHPLYDLMQHILAGSTPGDVSNLTWKEGAEVHINPPTFSPKRSDYANLSPQRLVKMVLRYRELQKRASSSTAGGRTQSQQPLQCAAVRTAALLAATRAMLA